MSYSIRQINVFICPALTIPLEAEVNPSSSASGGKFPSFIFHQQQQQQQQQQQFNQLDEYTTVYVIAR